MAIGKHTAQLHRQSLDQKLIGNMLFNFLGQFYVLILGFAVVPYVLHRLGPGLYGVLATVATLGGFGSMFNLGMGNALSKYIAEYHWQENFERIRTLLQTGLGVSLIGGVASFLLLILLKKPMSVWLFHGDPTVDSYIGFALWIAALGTLLSPTVEAFSAIPMGLQRFEIYNRVNVFVASVRNLGMVLALALGFYIKAILLIYIASSLTNLLAYMYYARQLIPGLKLRPKVSRPDLEQLLCYSFSVLLVGLSGLVIVRVDRLLVAYFLPIAAVAFYVVPYSLAEKTGVGVNNITSVVFPSISELSAMQEQDKVRELYLRATKTVILVGLPLTAVIVAYSRPLLQWWVGQDFALRGTLTLQILALGYMVNVLGYVPVVVTQGLGQPGIAAKYSVLNAIINVIGFIILIPRFGIAGAASGFLISMLVVNPLLIRATNQALGVPWITMIGRSYARPFVCGSIAFGVLWTLRSHANSLMGLIACSGLGLGVYAGLALVGAIDNRERTVIYDQISLFFRRSRGPVSI